MIKCIGCKQALHVLENIVTGVSTSTLCSRDLFYCLNEECDRFGLITIAWED